MPLSKRFAAATRNKTRRSFTKFSADRCSIATMAPHREIVLANAAAALVAAGRSANFLEGVRLAAHSIDSGAARERLDAFVAFSQTESIPAFS